MLNDDLDIKLRLIQAKEIMKSTKSVSFSGTLNNCLRRGLRKLQKNQARKKHTKKSSIQQFNKLIILLTTM